jgi:hypothetical protein
VLDFEVRCGVLIRKRVKKVDELKKKGMNPIFSI